MLQSTGLQSQDLATEHAHGYQVGKGGGRDKLGVWGQQIQTM